MGASRNDSRDQPFANSELARLFDPQPCGLARRIGLWQDFLMDSTTPASGPGRGSAGNVLAAICSFLIPGLGQLTQGRALKAILHFGLAAILWTITFFTFGYPMHLWSCWEAARWKG